jgi:Mrp family chromosome partitioning ATPase
VAPNPPALLGSEKMASFLREMMSSFQFVILDTPPVLPMADARVLARMVEGVVFVVRAGQVPKPMLRRAFTLLEATGANVLGAVLNCADARGAGDSYYRYYHQYYEH